MKRIGSHRSTVVEYREKPTMQDQQLIKQLTEV